MALGVLELIILALVGLTCVGVVLAVVLAAASRSARRSPERHDVMHCPDCRAVVSPLDRHCPNCGHPLKPQGIEELERDL